MRLNIKHLATPSRIIVGLSGGVDSAVAAFLLREAGHEVQAIFMKNWEDDAANCPFEEDLNDAQSVCDKLGISLKMVNFADAYWERVFALFLEEYRLGRTPNPDILCNKEIKFKAFLDYAKLQGADYIATGHYARLSDHYPHQLLKGLDPLKDQSYFLYALNQGQLSHSLFPVGHLKKEEVRQIAKQIGLGNFAKKDSTGICFIGERKFKTFLNEYLPKKPGPIQTLDGEVLGEHEGLIFYTIGQRQGIQIGGKKNKAELAWYVAHKDMEQNALIVVQGDHPALYKTSLLASDVHWIGDAPVPTITLSAKTRYRQADQACRIEALDENSYHVSFVLPQRAITPGQSIVFYQDDICLGGGIIDYKH